MSNSHTVEIKLAADAAQHNAALDAAAQAVGSYAQRAGQAGATAGAAHAAMGAAARNAAGSTEQLAKSQGLAAWQIQQLGYQINDLVVQLQAGQSPMTVLVQQGSQVVGMFGGMGAAARALATYISPLRVGVAAVAAVVGTVAYSMYTGAQETRAYAQALALSGNAAGVTRAQLTDMADAAGKSTASHSAAAAAIAQLASNGRVAGDSLQRYTELALRMERTVGQPVADTVQAFGELGKAPVAASLKLNDSLNYLTGSVYRQIRALQEQGQTEQAAALAQKAYADAMADRVRDVTENVGTLERAWNAVTKAARGAKDAVLAVGRETSPADTVATLRQRLAELDSRPRSIYAGASASDERERAALEADIKRKETALAFDQALARQQADDAKRERAGIELSELAASGLSRRVQLARELQRVNQLADDSPAADREARRAEAMAAVERKYRDVFAEGIDIQIGLVRRGEEIKAEYVARGLAGVTAARDAGLINDRQVIEAQIDLERGALDSKIAAVARERDLTRGKVDSAKDVAALDGQLAVLEAERVTQRLKAYEKLAEYDRARVRRAQEIYAAERAESEAARQAEQARIDQAKEAAQLGLLQYNKANRQAVEDAQLEYQLVGATQKERDIAVGLRRVELELDREILRIQALKLDAESEAAYVAEARDAAVQARQAVRIRAEAAETSASVQSIEATAHGVWTNVLQGGQDIWAKIRNTAKATFFDWLWQQVGRKWTLQVATQLVGGGAGGGGVVSALGSAAGSGGNMLSMVGNAGSMVSMALGNFGAGLTTGLSSTLSGAGLSAGIELGSGLMASGATAGGIGTMVGAAAPYVAAAIGVYKIAKSLEGGETRSGASYTMGSSGEAVYSQGPSGGEIAGEQSRGLFGGTVSTINSLLGSFGSSAKVAGFTAGLESSGNGKGFQFAGGTINGRGFGEYLGRDGGQLKFHSQDAGTALANYATDLQRSVLEALQVADLGGAIGQWVAQLGDIESMTAEQVSTAMIQVTAFQQLDAVLAKLPLPYLRSQGIAAAAELVKAAGSMDNFTGLLGNYIDRFYSAQEKTAQLTRNASAEFSKLGITMPQSTDGLRAWYRAEVERLGAQDLSVEANAKAYTSILALAGAVDQLAPAASDAAGNAQAIADQRAGLQRQLWEAEGNTAALRAEELGKLDPTNRALQTRIWQLQDEKAAAEAAATARKQSLADARTALDAAAAAERTRLNGQLQAAQDAQQRIGSLFDSLRNAVRELYGEVSSTAQMTATSARGLIAGILAGGAMPSQDELGAAISAARRGLETTLYASKFDADRARLGLASDLATLRDRAGVQLSTADQAVGLAKSQLSTLDELLQAQHDLLDEAAGTKTAVLSVTAAVQAVEAAIREQSAATTPGQSTATPSVEKKGVVAMSGGFVTDAGGVANFGGGASAASAKTATVGSGIVFGVSQAGARTMPFDLQAFYNANANDPGALARKLDALGVSNQEAADAFGIDVGYVNHYLANAGIQRFADGGFFDGGLRIVGERGPEIEATGPARYWDAATTRRMLAPAANDAGVPVGLTEVMRALQADGQAQARAALALLSRLFKTVDTWDHKGMPPVRGAV